MKIDPKLEQRALEWMIQRLERRKTLGALCAERMRTNKGRVRTFVPPEKGDVLYDNFDHALQVELCDWRTGLLHTIIHWMDDNPEGLVLLGNTFHSSDRCVQYFIGHVMTYGKEVFHCIHPDQVSDLELVDRIIGQGFRFVAIFSYSPWPVMKPPENMEIKLDDLTKIVQDATAILIEVYDGDELLSWEPDDEEEAEASTKAT